LTGVFIPAFNSPTSYSTKRFSWKWLCRHSFWRSRNAYLLNHVQISTVYSRLSLHSLKLSRIYSPTADTQKAKLFCSQDSLHFQFVPNVHWYISFNILSVNGFGFGFSTNEIFPQWPAYLVAKSVILIFSKTLIFPEWTSLARILATALVFLSDGFLHGRVVSVVTKSLLFSISERRPLLEFSFGAPYAQHSKQEIQKFF
jgi:hypothetical protein